MYTPHACTHIACLTHSAPVPHPIPHNTHARTHTHTHTHNIHHLNEFDGACLEVEWESGGERGTTCAPAPNCAAAVSGTHEIAVAVVLLDTSTTGGIVPPASTALDGGPCALESGAL